MSFLKNAWYVAAWSHDTRAQYETRGAGHACFLALSGAREWRRAAGAGTGERGRYKWRAGGAKALSSLRRNAFDGTHTVHACTVTSKGQVTIPKRVRKALGIAVAAG